MYQFIESNWLSILSIIIGILVSFFFYWLQRKQGASATFERKKRATAELLDVVESYIINKQHLSQQIIDNLIHASERDHAVDLRPACTSVTLLQDVAFRLQRSRHLDIPQKSEYSEAIVLLIGEIQLQRGHLPRKFLDEESSRELAKLLKLLPEDKGTEAEELLSLIATGVQKRLTQTEAKHFEEFQAASFAALAGVVVAIASGFLGNQAFTKLSSDAFTSTLTKSLPIFGVAMLLMLTLAGVALAIRNRRRLLGRDFSLRRRY